MKTSVAQLTKINTENLSSLTTVVEERIAFGFASKPKISFSVAQLWNIQRNHKSAAIRRNRLF